MVNSGKGKEKRKYFNVSIDLELQPFSHSEGMMEAKPELNRFSAKRYLTVSFAGLWYHMFEKLGM